MKAILLLLVFSLTISSAQWNFEADIAQSEMQVSGTSTIHDWESEVENFKVKGTVDGQQIKNLAVEVKTKAIKSGKSIMDEKTYDALKAEKYPTIAFNSSSLTINGMSVTGQGQLTIAGVTRPIELKANVLERSDEKLKVGGAVKLKMTDYKIDPPTAMFGSIQTGDEITVSYELLLKN